MNEEINKIKEYFNEYRYVSVAKQCKREYIVYSYFQNYVGTAIVRMVKYHYKSRDLNCEKRKLKKINVPIENFFNDIIYNLVDRGYKLEDWS